MSEQSSAQAMQFGIMSVSDITRDPTTGITPSEQERIKATTAIAVHAEEVGLDDFAIGEHHNPPFWSSSPTTFLAALAAQTGLLDAAERGGRVGDHADVAPRMPKSICSATRYMRAASSVNT